MDKTYIVIPAYNEQNSIKKVIQDLKKQGYMNIIVVDDGSIDKTGKIAKQQGAIVLSHLINRGQGAALKTGIDFALMKKADIIVTFDADGQFLAKDIKKVIMPVKKGNAEVVLGSRFLGKAKNIPLFKKIVLKLGVLLVFFLYGIKVTDSQNGFRAFSRHAASQIEIRSNKMEHAGEIFHEIKKNNLAFKEVPVTVLYTRYSLQKGQSWSRSIMLGLKMILKKLMV
ncbi:glycosyltransferase family 2 protein [Candidatus Woesearchaeota archaeon]|nr:glycosyltransferase family 2 protein [Candidatus Woesearchaeota archaeon]